MRILLLADDSITVQRVIALIFAKEPVQVVAVGDGRQALKSIAARKPDIILAGTSLPHLDGYDLAKQVRDSPEWRLTPVLLLSGAFELVDQARLKSSGADGVIEKPVEPTAVIRRVKELLGLKSDDKPASSGRLVTSAGGPQDKKLPPQSPPPAVTSTRPAPSNWDQLRAQSGLDANAPSVESSSARGADYLDTLDAGFESLDQQPSGREPGAPPAGVQSAGETRNAVFEADVDWFEAKDTQARDESAEPVGMIAEPEARTVPSLEEALTVATPETPATLVEPQAEAHAWSEAPAAVTAEPPMAPLQYAAPQARGVADDFAALLAYEQGEPHAAFADMAPLHADAPALQTSVAPVITDEMLDSIADRVAARLNSSLGEQWRDVMAATVRSAVSETSERLVREEIDRIKNNKA